MLTAGLILSILLTDLLIAELEKHGVICKLFADDLQMYTCVLSIFV